MTETLFPDAPDAPAPARAKPPRRAAIRRPAAAELIAIGARRFHEADPDPARELIVDNFAGGGGASTGIAMAVGRHPDLAINHDAAAIAMHLANHPATLHYCQSVWAVSPEEATRGRPVGLAWFSPDCKHFSKAKGGKPVERQIRDLAWVAVKWAKTVRPRIIMLENVEEFVTWGPLGDDGRPCKARRGQIFRKWLNALKALGYKVESREMRACDYGAPTIRKRFFLIARCDGRPIVWPEPTHGAPDSDGVREGRLKPWRTAAEIIDWSLPCPSIFLTREEGRAVGCNRPLADATMARIARGVQRYVLDAAKPFIVNLTHHGGDRIESVDDPMRTVTGAHRGEKGIVAPVFTYGQQGGAVRPADEPHSTITASRKDTNALVAPFMVPRYGERDGQLPRSRSVEEPAPTIVPDGNGGSLVAPFLAGCGGRAAQSPPKGVDQPMNTVTAKADQILTAPVIVRTAHGERDKTGKKRGRGDHDAAAPLPTVTASPEFAITAAHVTKFSENSDGHMPDEPIHTVMAGAPRHGIVAAHLTKFNTGSTGQALDEPAPTVTANSYIKRPGGAPPQGVVAAFLAQNNEGPRAGVRARSVEAPVSTVLQSGSHQSLVTAEAAHLLNLKGSDRRASPADHPAFTVTSGGFHVAEVRAFMAKYYGTGDGAELGDPAHTVTTKDRFGLVTVEGEDYQIVDIGMRMLIPRELFNAQGFPPNYIIDPVFNGKPMTKTEQVSKAGNSVSPVLAEALVRANYAAPAAANDQTQIHAAE